MYSDGQMEPEFHGTWGLIKSGQLHLLLDMNIIKRVQFVETENQGKPILNYARFSDVSDETIVSAHFPNPYLEDSDNLGDFQPEKLSLFEKMHDRDFNWKDVITVRPPRDGYPFSPHLVHLFHFPTS